MEQGYEQRYDGLMRKRLSYLVKKLKDLSNGRYENMFELYQKLINIVKNEKNKRKRKTYLREAESLVESMGRNIESSEELKKLLRV